ncbi:MAG: FAD-binding oxidoreductase [Candidatus Limnocylindrales bacterium]
MTSSPVTSLSIPELRTAIRGRVITPDDAEYDSARAVMMGGIDRRPAAIVRVADAADVAEVVRIARDTGIELAVRSGGHSSAGHSTTDGGIVIDLRDMRAIDIDPEAKTAWAETGLTAVAYSTAVSAHGLGTGFGDTGSVGIGGITTGGGIGYLARRDGLTIDSLLAAEVVTADGELHRVDAVQEPDLFWAIRGGGGNFGVATRFQFRLHEVDPFVGGLLLLPATPEVVEGFVALAEAAPDELSTIANVMPCPPMPFVPEDRHGELIILAFMAYAGPVDAAERALAPFRALAEPLADLVHPIAYPEIYPPDDPDYHPTAVARTMFIDRVDLDVARLIVERLTASNATMRVAQLRVLGGAMARVPNEATAFAHRHERILVNLAAFYEGPDDMIVRHAWVEEFVDALRQDSTSAYVNFVGDEGEAGVRSAYPGATWDRLAAIKARYDPTNLFRLNQNIPPLDAGTARA